MGIFEWAALGALMLAVLIFSARIMRRGITTLDDDRARYLERMAEDERQLAEDRKRISARDLLCTMHAALADFLRLEGNPPGSGLEVRGHLFSITSPDGKTWQVELEMRERLLASTHRVLHGRSHWLLRGEGVQEVHDEMSGLMASLNAHWHGMSADDAPAEPDFLLRRLAGAKRARLLAKGDFPNAAPPRR